MTEPKKSFFDKLKRGLFMTHTEIIEKMKESLTPDLPIDQSAIDRLEEGLLGADVGAELTMSLVGRLEQRVRDERITNMERLTQVIREETRALIPQRKASTIEIDRAQPFVILDTAGRLHNKSHLLQELSKIHRVIDKELPGAPHETLLVIDGTTGQNGVSQAAAFLEAAKVTGMIVTKLDGTAKGGVILSIMRQFDIPVKFVGVGEGADDLIPFDPQDYVDTLFA